MRIALAQVNATVGDLDGNADLVVGWTRRAARQGAAVIVFPEMMLTGYPVEDLALRASFVETSVRRLHATAARLAAEGLGGGAGGAGVLGRRGGVSPRTPAPPPCRPATWTGGPECSHGSGCRRAPRLMPRRSCMAERSR